MRDCGAGGVVGSCGAHVPVQRGRCYFQIYAGHLDTMLVKTKFIHDKMG